MLKKIFFFILFILIFNTKVSAEGYYGFLLQEKGIAGQTPAVIRAVAYDPNTPVDQAEFVDQAGNPVLANKEFKVIINNPSTEKKCDPEILLTDEKGEMIFGCYSNTLGALSIHLEPVIVDSTEISPDFVINFEPNQAVPVTNRASAPIANNSQVAQQQQQQQQQAGALTIPAPEVTPNLNLPENINPLNQVDWYVLVFGGLGAILILTAVWVIIKK